MSGINRRVAALEAAAPKPAQDAARAGTVAAAVSALLDAAEATATGWNKAECGRQFLQALLSRLDADTTTAADHTMLAGLPACHLPPHALVWVWCELEQARPAPADMPREWSKCGTGAYVMPTRCPETTKPIGEGLAKVLI